MLHHRLRAASGARGVDLSKNLIAHYTMDSIDGSTLFDELGNYDGTIYGATAVIGKDGNALSFNGSSDYVDLGATAGSELTGDFTISIWVRNFESNDGVYISKYNQVPSFFEIGRSTVGSSYYVRHSDSSGVDVLLKDSVTTASYGDEFVNIVMLRSGSTTSIRVNNVQKNSISTSRNLTGTTYPLHIGARSFPAAREFGQAYIDHIRIYSEACGIEKLTAIYNEI